MAITSFSRIFETTFCLQRKNHFEMINNRGDLTQTKRNIGSGVKIVSAGNSVKHNCVHLSLSSLDSSLDSPLGGFLKEYKSPGQISGPGDVTLKFRNFIHLAKFWEDL